MGTETYGDATATRRTLLAAVAAGSAGVVAGCMGGDADHPDPVALDDGQNCDNCDMKIEMHPGPVGQSFYGDDRPPAVPEDREDGIAWFCSANCEYTFVREHEEEGYEPMVSYATDYSSVDWSLREEEGTTVISAHLGPEAFADVTDLTFVVDSDVEGAMGASLIGFSEAADAESFADEHGGTLLTHDEITLEIVSGLGM